MSLAIPPATDARRPGTAPKSAIAAAYHSTCSSEAKKFWPTAPYGSVKAGCGARKRKQQQKAAAASSTAADNCALYDIAVEEDKCVTNVTPKKKNKKSNTSLTDGPSPTTDNKRLMITDKKDAPVSLPYAAGAKSIDQQAAKQPHPPTQKRSSLAVIREIKENKNQWVEALSGGANASKIVRVLRVCHASGELGRLPSAAAACCQCNNNNNNQNNNHHNNYAAGPLVMYSVVGEVFPQNALMPPPTTDWSRGLIGMGPYLTAKLGSYDPTNDHSYMQPPPKKKKETPMDVHTKMILDILNKAPVASFPEKLKELGFKVYGGKPGARDAEKVKADDVPPPSRAANSTTASHARGIAYAAATQTTNDMQTQTKIRYESDGAGNSVAVQHIVVHISKDESEADAQQQKVMLPPVDHNNKQQERLQQHYQRHQQYRATPNNNHHGGHTSVPSTSHGAPSTIVIQNDVHMEEYSEHYMWAESYTTSIAVDIVPGTGGVAAAATPTSTADRSIDLTSYETLPDYYGDKKVKRPNYVEDYVWAEKAMRESLSDLLEIEGLPRIPSAPLFQHGPNPTRNIHMFVYE